MEGPEYSHSCAGPIPRALGKWERRSEVEAEIRVLIALPVDELKARLRQCIAGTEPILEETLVYLVREAIANTDRALLNLAFEALNRLATPVLLSHARILPLEERREHPQEVLMRVYAAAERGGTAIDYAEVNFNHYLKRRSIERLKERNTTSRWSIGGSTRSDEYAPWRTQYQNVTPRQNAMV